MKRPYFPKGVCIILHSHKVERDQLSRGRLIDVLWGQPIKLAQMASTSELRENQWNDLLFFENVPCHFCRASEKSRVVRHFQAILK